MSSCPFCRAAVPDLAGHYAVGPDTCPTLRGAFDAAPDRSNRRGGARARRTGAEAERQRREQRAQQVRYYRARRKAGKA